MINYDDDDYGGVRWGEEMMVMIDLRWGRRSGVFGEDEEVSKLDVW